MGGCGIPVRGAITNFFRRDVPPLASFPRLRLVQNMIFCRSCEAKGTLVEQRVSFSREDLRSSGDSLGAEPRASAGDAGPPQDTAAVAQEALNGGTGSSTAAADTLPQPLFGGGGSAGGLGSNLASAFGMALVSAAGQSSGSAPAAKGSIKVERRLDGGESDGAAVSFELEYYDPGLAGCCFMAVAAHIPCACAYAFVCVACVCTWSLALPDHDLRFGDRRRLCDNSGDVWRK